MRVNIECYLFHGLGYNSNQIETLTEIFESGYIYTRNSLQKYLGDYKYQKFENEHPANWNGLDAVSVTCHPSNTSLIETYNLKKDNHDNAYEEHIPCGISLVLEPSLLDEYEIKQKSWKMNFEIQILGDIPIKYIKAIAINYSTRRYISEDWDCFEKFLNETINGNRGKYFNKYYDRIQYLRDDFFEGYTPEQIFEKRMKYLYKIKEIIDIYKLNIPIIDLKYGYVISLPDETIQKQKILELQKKYKKYLEIIKSL